MELSEFITNAIKCIQRGVVDRKSPYRFPILSTLDKNNVSQRILVARAFDDEKMSLIVYTDSASEKFSQLKQNPNCSLLFWDSRKKLQVQVRGKANFIKNKDVFWNKLSDNQKKEYSIKPSPGTMIKNYDSYDYDDVESRFTVISIEFRELHILELCKDGHKRAQCNLLGDKKEEFWVCP